MANEEHLAILKQGVEAWNEWRKANFNLVKPDLSGADLRNADLNGANLSHAFLRGVNLGETNLGEANFSYADLIGAKLKGANLSHVDLRKTALRNAELMGANLTRADLVGANLMGANLGGADLSDANLNLADLYLANLTDANLPNANLSESNLRNAYLYGANLYRANLTNADLSRVHALYTNFEGATLTGACIEDWNINTHTNLNDVICDYVYLRYNQQERRPSDSNKNFAPGEFKALFQKVQETIDLIFADGIDWKAFFQSFQELQSQYADQELSIQAIEKKAGGAFVIRLETPVVDVDKAAIESAATEKYQAQLHQLEAQYRTQLHAKEIEIESYRRESANMMEITKLLASRPINVEANAVSNSQSSGDTYNGPIKATNFAPHGTAIGGTFNDYSQTITNNLDEIQQLITTLRFQAEQFPQDARNEVLEHLNDLQEDLKHPDKVKPSRLKAALGAILAISVGVATATDFANNVLELGNKFGVELVHPQGSQSAQFPHSQGTQTVDVKRLEGGH